MSGEFGFFPPTSLASIADISGGDLAEAFYVPQPYEPNYAYPLLVLFHGEGEDEQRMVEMMPSLSRRNHIGLSLRAPETVSRQDKIQGYSWGSAFGRPNSRRRNRDDAVNPSSLIVEQASDLEIFRSFMEKSGHDPVESLNDSVIAAIKRARTNLHIHSERVFLVGVGQGAATAFRLGLSHPEKFAGIVSLNGWIPDGFPALLRYQACRRLRVFIAHGCANSQFSYHQASRQARMLRNAGLKVSFSPYPTDERIGKKMLIDVDHWLIKDCIITDNGL